MDKFNALTIDKLELCFRGSIALHNTMEAEEIFDLANFRIFPLKKSLGIVKYGVELKDSVPDMKYRYFGTITIRLGDDDEQEPTTHRYFWLTINNEMLYSVNTQREIKILIKLLASSLNWELNNITKFELAYDLDADFTNSVRSYIENTQWDNIFLGKVFPQDAHIPFLTHECWGTATTIELEHMRIKGSDTKFQLYCYDKAQEITHSGKFYVEEYYERSLPVLWRCELRCYKPQFEEYLNNFNIDWNTLFENILFTQEGLDSIMEYLSSRLLRFRRNRNNIKSVYEVIKDFNLAR